MGRIDCWERRRKRLCVFDLIIHERVTPDSEEKMVAHELDSTKQFVAILLGSQDAVRLLFL